MSADKKRITSWFVTTTMPNSILGEATDWNLLVDSINCQVMFPPKIAITSLRPDLILWARNLWRVIIVEFTIPVVDNLQKVHAWMAEKYKDLIDQCQKNRWEASLF